MQRLLTAERAELACDPTLATARALLEAYLPRDAEQARFRREMLEFLEAHPEDAHRRSCVPGHLTASSVVVDRSRGRALLTHHKKLERWLQLGGHCDGDSNLPAVALREAREESGLDELVIDPRIVDLDIHVIPARPGSGPGRPGEPEHLHLDARFLIHAPAGARETASAESHRLAWISPAELESIEADDSLRRLFRLAF